MVASGVLSPGHASILAKVVSPVKLTSADSPCREQRTRLRTSGQQEYGGPAPPPHSFTARPLTKASLSALNFSGLFLEYRSTIANDFQPIPS